MKIKKFNEINENSDKNELKEKLNIMRILNEHLEELEYNADFMSYLREKSEFEISYNFHDAFEYKIIIKKS